MTISSSRSVRIGKRRAQPGCPRWKVAEFDGSSTRYGPILTKGLRRKRIADLQRECFPTTL
jgi:hypothetical protein